MEFLRFGSSIPGGYWGCCAMDIIQCFKFDPAAKASIQLVDGDGGHPITDGNGFKFAGPTYLDIFLQRLRYGTFGTADMPNHGFLVILTDWQITSGHGVKWLKILKEQGFEFIRTVDNSVYSGKQTITKPGVGDCSSHKNYLFGLFRNIGTGCVGDPYAPPAAWKALPSVVPEAWEQLTDTKKLTEASQAAQLPIYNALPKGKFMSEKELEAQGVPITYAGQRSANPQELKKIRESKTNPVTKAKAAPFAAAL